MDEFPSGQRGQTVNLLLFSFGGPNPPSSTRLGLERNALRAFVLFSAEVSRAGNASKFDEHRQNLTCFETCQVFYYKNAVY